MWAKFNEATFRTYGNNVSFQLMCYTVRHIHLLGAQRRKSQLRYSAKQ